LKGTAWAEAQVDSIRLKLLKIGAIVRLSVRRVLLQLRSGYPWKDLYTHAFVNSFDNLVKLERHARELTACPTEWMPWNYRQTLERNASLPDSAKLG
jgi:hypothetical protein